MNIDQLPKVEETGDLLFLTLKHMGYSNKELTECHVSLILNEHFLITFADTDKDIFSALKARLRNSKNRARVKKADYLFYLILDYLVDGYYPVFDEMYSQLEMTEAGLMQSPEKNRIREIHDLKKIIVDLRKTLFPLEKGVGTILRDEFDLIDDANELFFRDVHDHLLHLIHTSDSNREFVSSLVELNASNMNNSMNQTIKILTVITTIFIPITFIAGIYGMNFENMPELKTRNGYFIILGFMGLVAFAMVIS
ncbi:MAG: magnesium/cobalt transporter CorA [Bacteroidales bacterium]|nr:magnesium/cobalt transporter CorA [Bacteroidales bacterium]